MSNLGPLTIHDDPGHTFSDGEVDYGGYRIDAPGVEQVAFVWRKNRRFGSDQVFGADEAEAYAKLFAAAPDLLEALDEILNYRGGADSALEDEYVMARAHVAIAKATGAAT
jgi:hypothetical protein